MQQIKPGTQITLTDMEVETVVVEIVNENENTVGLLNTQTFAVIYQFENVSELVSFLPLLGAYKIK